MAAPKQKKRLFRVPLAAGLVVMLVTGGGIALLIWAKLRLVTGVPRTVYAQPPEDGPGEDGPPDSDEQPADK